ASPVVTDPDGSGKVVYVGDQGFTAHADGGHLWAINGVDPNAAADCSLKWSYSDFGDPPGSQTLAGSWTPPAFATDKNGRALVFFGTGDPDSGVYALDAATGARVWRFPTQLFGRDDDVGAAPTISPPGALGMTDGAVYITGKDRMTYALNLRTGRNIL